MNGKIKEDWVASVFLATNFLSLALSSFISLLIRKTSGNSSLLLEVAEVCLAFRCVHISSPRLQPSWSKTLRDSGRASSVASFFVIVQWLQA